MSTDRRRGIGPLLAGWVAYWSLLAVGAGPALRAVWRATHVPEPGTGAVDLSLGDGVLSLVTRENGAVAFRAEADVLMTCVALAAGPLVMWLVWLAARRRRAPIAAEVGGARP